MTDIEELISQYPELQFEFEPMPSKLGGLTIGNQITINSKKSPEEQLQWLYEELGHAFTSNGDITHYHINKNMIQEKRARVWGMKHHVPLTKLEELATERVDDDYEIATELGVRVDYLHDVGIMYGFSYK